MNDLKFAFRQLLKSPGFTAVAVLALALGIGANTAIFSVVNAVLLKPLPYDQPDQLVRVYETFPEQGWREAGVTAGNYVDWRAQNQVFQDMAVMSGGDFNLTGDGEPVRLKGSKVSASFFNVLHLQPILGRGFVPEEERYGSHYSVILSHGLWQRRFGGDPNLLGKTLILNQNTHTIVGVMPAGFDFPDRGTEVWSPMAFRENDINNRGAHNYRVIGRLKSAVTLEQAERELNIIAKRLGEIHRHAKGWGVEIVLLKERLVGKSRRALLILLGAVGFVLLIACANVANLLLARAAARHKEFAIRAALGAGRLRVIRQLLTESLLLAFIGGAFGLLLANWGIHALVALSPANLPRVEEISIDRWVLFFTLGVSLATGAIFGLAPALQASKADVNQALKDTGRGSTGGFARNRVRSLLVVSEVALSLVLLVSAGLMIRSFSRLHDVNPGFHTERVLTMSIGLPSKKYPDLARRVPFIDQILERVGTVPGVVSLGMINNLPLSGEGNSIAVSIDGFPSPAPGEAISAGHRQVSPNYFRAIGVPFVKGRDFNEHDRSNSIPVAIVNESFVRQFMRGQEPIGQRLRVGDDGPGPVEVVAVVKDVRHSALDTQPKPEMYFPYMQRCWSSVNLVARTASNPSAMASAIRKEVQVIDQDQPVHNIRTMEQLVMESVAQRRAQMLLLGIFAGVALVLAAVGIYGVMSYSVTQRTHEMGIRMALGAQRRDVIKIVIKHGMLLALAGVTVGLAAAFILTRVMSTLLFEIKPTDLATYLGVSVLLMTMAMSACAVPARRATKVDPVVALRYE